MSQDGSIFCFVLSRVPNFLPLGLGVLEYFGGGWWRGSRNASQSVQQKSSSLEREQPKTTRFPLSEGDESCLISYTHAHVYVILNLRVFGTMHSLRVFLSPFKSPLAERAEGEAWVRRNKS